MDIPFINKFIIFTFIYIYMYICYENFILSFILKKFIQKKFNIIIIKHYFLIISYFKKKIKN